MSAIQIGLCIVVEDGGGIRTNVVLVAQLTMDCAIYRRESDLVSVLKRTKRNSFGLTPAASKFVEPEVSYDKNVNISKPEFLQLFEIQATIACKADTKGQKSPRTMEWNP